FSLQQRRWILSGAAFFTGLIVLTAFVNSAPGPESYALAEAAVSQWQANGDTASYLEMKKALKKVPTLERKYNAIIAQKLFQKDRLADALNLAYSSIQQIEEEAPFHAAYGRTTLLIEQGLYQDALEKSVGLKEKMQKLCNLQNKNAGGLYLYVHNLLRIACLQKELKNKPGEKAAWDELERFLGSKSNLSQAIFTHFRDKGLDLSHYIIERRKQL
ncbi:MAG TPA: hypothetical protein VLE96_03320, partial [Chlamydiales bacterium]|nr:hypothetical protein [Chlamydiales bacterium]